MDLSQEQLTDIRAAVRFYQLHHISVNSPRYKEYDVILQLLENYKDKNDCYIK